MINVSEVVLRLRKSIVFTGGWVGFFIVLSLAPLIHAREVNAQTYDGVNIISIANLNLRSSAGIQNSVSAIIPPNTYGSILAGPTRSGVYAWFSVNFAVGEGSMQGWVASDFIKSTNGFFPLRLRAFALSF